MADDNSLPPTIHFDGDWWAQAVDRAMGDPEYKDMIVAFGAILMMHKFTPGGSCRLCKWPEGGRVEWPCPTTIAACDGLGIDPRIITF